MKQNPLRGVLYGALTLGAVTVLGAIAVIGLNTVYARAGEVYGIVPATPLPAEAAAVMPAADAQSKPASASTDGAFKLTGNPPYLLSFDQMYAERSVRYGLVMSPYLKALDGNVATMEGYMAPPLKSSLDFFVLTQVPMSLCPFCSSNADWPDNIILVYIKGQPVEPTTAPVRVTGRIELGTKVDDQTGFVSQVRLYADKMELVG